MQNANILIEVRDVGSFPEFMEDNQQSDNSIHRIPSPSISEYICSEDDDSDETTREEFGQSKRGRKGKTVWAHFKTVKHGNKVVSNICLNCKKHVSPKPYRMQAHLDTCLRHARSTTILPLPAIYKPAETQSEAAQKLKTTMKSYIRQISSSEQKELDILLAKFVYAANLPFTVVGNLYFKELMNKAHPGYRLPSHDVVGSTLLSQVYNDAQKDTMERLNNKKVTIMQDGWSSPQNEPIICHSVSTGEETFFLNGESAEENQKTSQFCLEILENNVEQAETKYKCKVIAAVTDNCNAMISMRNLLLKKRPEFIVYGCNSHYLNLVGKHFSDPMIQSNVQKVHTYLRDHHYTSAMISKLNANRPVLSGDTRWNSNVDSQICFCKNYTAYLEILLQYEKELTNRKASSKDKDSLKVVLDIVKKCEFYDKVKESINTLTPICVAIDKVRIKFRTKSPEKLYRIMFFC